MLSKEGAKCVYFLSIALQFVNCLVLVTIFACFLLVILLARRVQSEIPVPETQYIGELVVFFLAKKHLLCCETGV